MEIQNNSNLVHSIPDNTVIFIRRRTFPQSFQAERSIHNASFTSDRKDINHDIAHVICDGRDSILREALLSEFPRPAIQSDLLPNARQP
jgi:hypothetical protein